MNAIIIEQAGGPEVLQLQQQPRPQPAAHEVLIRVHAAGVNRPDVLMRQGKYAGSGDVAGLTPGLVGLYQVNFQVPDNTPDGILPLVITQSGVKSNPTVLPVKH